MPERLLRPACGRGEDVRVREPETVAATSEPEPVAAQRTAARTAAGAILALQRSAGNGAVNHLLKPYNPLGGAYESARKAKENYVKGGKRGPITYDPSKRNKENYYGGFDVTYDPSPGKQILTIGLRGVTDFQPGIRLRKGRAVAVEPSAETAAAARKINKIKDPAKRAAEVAKWHWSSDGGPDAGDETTFMTKFKSIVETTWRGRHPFVCTRPYWEDLDAFVDIDVNLAKMDATHKAGNPNHLRVRAYKVPAGYIGGGADVHRTSGGKKGGPFSNLMTVTAVDVDPRADDLLIRHVTFDPGSTTVPKKRARDLKSLAKEMPNAKKGSTVPVSDLTVSPQGKDATERKGRFDAIAKIFTTAGMASSRIRFLAGGAGNVTDIIIGGGAPQTVVAHESGHMFGLDDEYTGSGAYAAGKKTEHTAFAAKYGEKGVMHAKSDSIMSEGSIVRRQHYVTFLDALKVVSGIEEWDFGKARKVEPPSPKGDFEVPESIKSLA
jgi:hypothetical protein